MIDPILATKITAPALRANLFVRNRLLQRLDAGIKTGHRLLLICAPAGAGKSTLASSWVRQCNKPVAWLSLDKGDNDFSSFWNHVIAAIQSVLPEIGQTARSALGSSEEVSYQALIGSIVNDLIELSTQLVLVLDDYHLIEAEQIHKSVNALIELLPVSVHLAIITRREPPLAVARLRVDGTLTEIRFGDLRFSRGEIDGLMNDIMNLNLSEDDIVTLTERTEGWVVGVQMAALSLQNMGCYAQHEFIQRFGGDDKFIMDYLMEVVLQTQSSDVLAFLLRTSVLDKLCGSLCDAILDKKDSALILEQLETANLFLIPLDNRRVWYRYHHLFADLLRRRFFQGDTKEDVKDICQRASRWHEGEGYTAEAGSYAMASEDYDFAAELIERNILRTFYRSETRLVYGWLNGLPVEQIRARPLLSAVYAGCLMLNHKRSVQYSEIKDLIEDWLQNAEDRVEQAVDPSPLEKHVLNLSRHYINKIRAYLANFLGEEPAKIVELSLKALDQLPKGEQMFRSAMMHILGIGYKRSREVNAAIKAFNQAWRLGEANGDLFNLSSSITNIALLTYESADLNKAIDICYEGLDVISRLAGGKFIPYTGLVYIALGSILSERCQFDDAIAAISEGIKLLTLANAEPEQQWGYVELAYIYCALGRIDQALCNLDEAKQVMSDTFATVDTYKARISAMAAKSNRIYLSDAVKWLNNHEEGASLFLHEDYDLVRMTRLRVTLARHKVEEDSEPSDLDPLLSQVEQQWVLASKRNIPRWQLEVLLLKTCLYQLQDKVDLAMNCFEQALEIGANRGYLRVFIDEGPEMIQLLRLAASQKRYQVFVGKLLAIIETLNFNDSDSLPTCNNSLREPLSPREFEVLQLMAEGAANPEIAKRLHISMSTVKTHVTHIFGKLGVGSRTQAIVRARELKLVG